ncbi:glycoside hydrolase family 38 C-terminal domain-containing protein [Clostridium sp.]|uniref:glycoside hydrolase family 38 N-terminal domain-containing protein n=1 Tax=Clostridium sp. TaxID=1506 RepID=UPI003F40FEE9
MKLKFLSKKLAALVFATTMATTMINPIITQAYDKSKTAHMLGNAHLDVAWNWRIDETIRECKTTFSRAIENLDKYDDYRFSQSQAQLYAYTQEYFPELFEQIKDKINEGKWDVTGGQWVEPDLNVPSGESLVRQSLYGQKYFKENLGVQSTVGWVPDVFGFSYNFPQILKKSGMDYFITTKLNWNDTNRWPHEVFNWQSPDGSSVLSYKPTTDYSWSGGGFGSSGAYDKVLNQPVQRGLSTGIALYGNGDHGGGPTSTEINGILSTKNNQNIANVEMSLAEDAFKSLESDINSSEGSNVSTIDNELYFEYHRGTYTTASQMKKYNRDSEILAEIAEKFASVAFLLGAIDYPAEKIQKAWEITALNQFHDILPGSSIHGVYLDAYNDAEIALNFLNAVKEDALNTLAQRINTTTTGVPVVLFNSLSWERNEYIEKELVFDNEVSDVEIKDSNGNVVESKVVNIEGNKATVLFKASVPSMGYSVYSAEVKENSYVAENNVTASLEDYTLENQYFKLTLNPETGNISSIIDKRNDNKEVLENGKEANELNILQDKPSGYEAWELDKDDMNAEATVINGLTGIELVEDNGSKATFKVWREWGESKFSSEITLYANEDRIDIKTGVDWNELQKCLKVAFPLSVSPEKATYEVAYGAIQRDTSWENRTTGAQFEVSGHKWADMTEGDYGVSILNDSKYGWDVLDNRLRLTLLKASSGRGGESDRGAYHEINYSIYPHAGSWNDADTVREAYNFNYDMDIMQTTSHEGALEKNKSFVSSDTKNVIVSAVKKAEESDDIVVRLYESEGKAGTKANISLPAEIESIEEVNLLEEPITNTSTEFNGNTFSTELKKHEIKTYKVKLKEMPNSMNTKVKSYPIDLSNAYNIDGISTDGNKADGDYSGKKEALSAELLGDSVISEGVSYNFGPKEDGKKNVIKAEGQEIELPNEKHDGLFILGNSVNSNLSGTVIVNYKDGTSKEEHLQFRNWKEEVGSFLDTYITNTIGARLTHTHTPKENTLDIDNNQYIYRISLDNTREVESITMPNADGIRVTAMSFVDGATFNEEDFESPSKVDGLAVETPYKMYSNEVYLNWNASTDNDEIARYRIYRSNKANMEGEVLIARTSNTEYTDKISSSPDAYYYRIVAEDISGNTAEASEVKSALAGSNVAFNKNVTVSSQVNTNEGGPKAVDGDLGSKWCATSGSKWLTIDLGEETDFGSVVISHAEAGGEGSDWNTRDFKVLISNDNQNWSEYDVVRGNTSAITTHKKDAKARYVKLQVDNGGKDGVARIYEIEVLANPTNDINDSVPGEGATITSINRGFKTVGLNYSKVSGAEKYKILYGTSDNIEEMKIIDDVQVNSVTIRDLEPNKTYYFRVIGKNYFGEGPSSEVGSIFIPNEEYASVNLDTNYNMDGIGSGTKNKADGNFDGIGWAYDGDLIDSQLKYDDLEFTIGPKDDGENNIVKAQGQTIALEEKISSSIYILASANNGSQNANFRVNYTDGTFTEKEISVNDWCSASKNDSYEVLVLENQHRLYNGGGNPDSASIDNKKVSINMYPMTLDENKIVKDITLPNNDKIKIFAINTGNIKNNEEIIVAKPSNLKSSSTNSTVNLRWDSPTSVIGLKEYVVYKDGKEFMTVPSNSNECTVENLRANTIYGFKIAARFNNNEESKPVSVNVRTIK